MGVFFVTLNQIKNILDADVLCGDEFMEEDIDFGYSCDLMSDVLAYVKSNVLLLTGLVHPQVVRTAEMLDIRAIVFVRGKMPTQELIEMAERRDMVILATSHALFTASGILYKNGLKGEEIAHDESTL